jgi:hypothetical protein
MVARRVEAVVILDDAILIDNAPSVGRLVF